MIAHDVAVVEIGDQPSVDFKLSEGEFIQGSAVVGRKGEGIRIAT